MGMHTPLSYRIGLDLSCFSGNPWWIYEPLLDYWLGGLLEAL